MAWNYRIIREEDPPINGEEQPVYIVAEVYYDEDGKPAWRTEGPAGPAGATVEELSNDIAWIIKALTLPVLSPDLKEIEPAQLLTDDILAAIEKDPRCLPAILRKSVGSA